MKFLSNEINYWQQNNSCGLLLFLYSVLLTKVCILQIDLLLLARHCTFQLVK